MQNLVLIGGGHSHAIALKQWGLNPLPDVQLTLITEVENTPYSGMLPGYVAGVYTHAECHINLPALAQFAGAQLIVDRAVGLDLSQNCVLFADRAPVPFDRLSINIGSTPACAAVPGAAEYAIPIKPVPGFLAIWRRLLQQTTQNPERALCLGIVGGGVGGVELALAMHSHLGQILRQAQQPLSHLEIHLFHRGAALMPERNPWVRRHLQTILRRRGIHLHLQETVVAVERLDRAQLTDPAERADEATNAPVNNAAVAIENTAVAIAPPRKSVIRCESGLAVACDRIFWVTHASAPQWPHQSGLATTDSGFIQVAPTLQSLSHSQVFAAGDIATMVQSPRPKAGVFAVRQGLPLFRNLQRSLQGLPLKPYKPQRRFLTLIGTAQDPNPDPNPERTSRSAIAAWGPLGWDSPLLWQWKDRIDRKFMHQFERPPV